MPSLHHGLFGVAGSRLGRCPLCHHRWLFHHIDDDEWVWCCADSSRIDHARLLPRDIFDAA